MPLHTILARKLSGQVSGLLCFKLSTGQMFKRSEIIANNKWTSSGPALHAEENTRTK
jgi:hypothetical protein